MEIHQPLIKEGIPLPSKETMEYALSIDTSVLEGTGHLLHYIMTAGMVADTMAQAYESATGNSLDRQRMMDLLIVQHAVKIWVGLAREGRAEEDINKFFREGGLPEGEQYEDLPEAHTFDDVDFALWNGERADIDPVVLEMLKRLSKRYAGIQRKKSQMENPNFAEKPFDVTFWVSARKFHHARHEDGTRDWAVTLKELAAWMTDRGMVTNLTHRMGRIKKDHVGDAADQEGDPYKGGGRKLINPREMEELFTVGDAALKEFCSLIGIEQENFYAWLKERLNGNAPDALAQELWGKETFPEGSFYPQGEAYRQMLRFFDFLRRANSGETHMDIGGNRLELDCDGIRQNLKNLLLQIRDL